MTAQVPEVIVLEGAPYSLKSLPLEPYLEEMETRPDFKSLTNAWSTCLWRGYVGLWEIRDYKLFLIRLGSCEDELAYPFESAASLRKQGEERTSIDLRHIFPDREPPIFASWYSGRLRVPLGDQLLYVHMGWGSWHRGERIIHLRRGHVIRERYVDHTARFLAMAERSPHLFSEDGVIEGRGHNIPSLEWLTEEGRALAERHMKR
jgi:hypothetical protein